MKIELPTTPEDILKNVQQVIEMLKEHCSTQEEFEAVDEDNPVIDDAFAFDHAYCVLLLGGKLD